PSGGPIGFHFTATGAGFAYAGPVTLTVPTAGALVPTSCSSGTFVGSTITTTGAGAFVCAFTVPAGTTSGNAVATDGASGATAMAAITITGAAPTLALSLASGPINTIVTATGAGFTYTGGVTITVGSTV